MEDKQINYNGTTHNFPGDFSDDEISSALAEYDKSSAQTRGVGAEEGSGGLSTPGMEKLGGTPPAVGRPKLAMKKTMLIGGGSDAPDEQDNETTGKSLANLGVGALKSGYGVSAPGILQSLTGAKTPAMVKKVAPWVDPVPKDELAGEVAMQGGLAMVGALEEGGARLPSRAVEGRAAATAEPAATGAAKLAKSAPGPNVGLEIAKRLPVVGKYVRMADWGRKLLSPEPAVVPAPEVPAHWGQSNVGPVEMWGRSIPKGQERVTAGAPVARPAPAWQQREAASKLQRAEPIPSNNFNGLKDAESADIKQQLEGQQESERAGADEIERKLFFMGNKPEGYTPKTLSLYDGQEKAIDVPLSKEEADAIYKGQRGGHGGAPPDEPTSGGGGGAGGEGRGGGSGSPGGNITPEPGQQSAPELGEGPGAMLAKGAKLLRRANPGPMTGTDMLVGKTGDPKVFYRANFGYENNAPRDFQNKYYFSNPKAANEIINEGGGGPDAPGANIEPVVVRGPLHTMDAFDLMDKYEASPEQNTNVFADTDVGPKSTDFADLRARLQSEGKTGILGKGNTFPESSTSADELMVFDPKDTRPGFEALARRKESKLAKKNQLKEGLKQVSDYTQPEPDDKGAGGGIIDRLKKFNKDEEGSMALPGTDIFRRMKSGPMSSDTATPILHDMVKNSQAQRFFPEGLNGQYDPSDVLIDPEYKGIQRFSPDEIRSMTPVQQYLNPAIVNRYMDAIHEGGDVGAASVFKRFDEMPDPRKANAAIEADKTLLQMQPDYEPHITEDLTGRRAILNGTHRSIASYKSDKPLDMSVYGESGELVPDSARPGAPGHEGVPTSSEIPSSFTRELNEHNLGVSKLLKKKFDRPLRQE